MKGNTGCFSIFTEWEQTSTGFKQMLLTTPTMVIIGQLFSGLCELSWRPSPAQDERSQRSNAISVGFQCFSPPLLGFKLISVVSAPKTTVRLIISPYTPSTCSPTPTGCTCSASSPSSPPFRQRSVFQKLVRDLGEVEVPLVPI